MAGSLPWGFNEEMCSGYKSLWWVKTEVYDFPTYEGLPNLDTFLGEFEIKLLEKQRVLALDVSSKATSGGGRVFINIL